MNGILVSLISRTEFIWRAIEEAYVLCGLLEADDDDECLNVRRFDFAVTNSKNFSNYLFTLSKAITVYEKLS